MKQLLAVILLIFCYSLQAQKGATAAYYYKGRKTSFPVNNHRLVMQLSAGETLATRRSELSLLLQVPDTSIKATATEKTVMAQLPAGMSAESIKGVLAALGKRAFINFVHPCFTSAYGKDMGYTDELVVKLKAATSETVFANWVKQAGCRVVRKYAFARDIYIVAAGAANGYDALAVANRFFESGLFEYAAPDLTLFDGLFTDPNDPLYAYQWAHNNTATALQYNGVAGTDMKLQQAWNISTGAGITIAVIDEGVDTGHADLKPHLLQGFDCLSGTANPGDGRPLAANRGHGTSCTGIIAGIAGNGIGVAGVAPDSRIIPINLAAANGFFTTESNIAAGFDYAWQNGADIISNSWGGGSPSDVLDDAIARAVTLGRGGKGSVVLFASGNNNAALSYPAVNSNVISVGGVNMCGYRKSPASFTCDGESWGASYGAGLDVVAPCVKIATTDISGTGGYNTAAGAAGDYFLRFNGTSSATPNTAGVVALILGANSNLTVNQVRNILESTCDKLPAYNYSMVAGQPNGTWNAETGHGLVNAFNAVQAAQSGFYCNVQVKASGATRFCAGGSVVISVVNPVPGTGYQWRKDGVGIAAGSSITAAATGNYDVVATAANGCIANAAAVTVTVLQNTPALFADAGIDTFVCAGQPVKLGGSPVAGNGAPWLPEKRAYGMDWQGNSFVKFNLSDPLQLDTIAVNMVGNAAYDAAQFFTGGDFTPYGYYAITQISNQLIRVDTAGGAQQIIGTAPAPAGYLWSGMAWDAATKNLYVLATATAGSLLFIIDPFTAALRPVAPVPVVSTEWVAISNAGNMFVMSDNNYVYKVNKVTGAAIALPNNVGANVVYQQDADFDPVTDSLYLSTIIQSQNFVGDLRTVNTTTGTSSIIGTLGGLSQIDATAIAGPGYRYLWLPATGLSSNTTAVPVATPTATTTYTLTVTDMCGNVAASQVTVHVSIPPHAVITAVSDSICVGETVRLSTESNSAYTYQWYLNGTPLPGASDSFYVAAGGGAYTVRIVNGACDSLSAAFIVKTCALLLNSNTAVQVCGSYFYDSGGALADYGNNASFTKTITASTPGSLPRLTLTSFSTEAGADTLTVYDGTDISSPVLASLSGMPAMPLTYTGSSGALTLRFTSNAGITAAGWEGTLVCYQPAVYRSRTTGNAGDVSTWQVKSGNGFVNASALPQVYDDSIIIQPGHTVSVNIPMQLDQLWVKSGAALHLDVPFMLNNGAGTDLQSDGTLVIGAAGTVNGSGNIVATGTVDNSASAGSDIMVNTVLAGASPQQMAAGGSFKTLCINNPSVTVGLNHSVSADTLIISNGAGAVTVTASGNPYLLTINRRLDLQSGRLLMAGNAVLNLAAGAVVAGAGNGSFVEGPVRVNTIAAGNAVLSFPTGNRVYRPLLLELPQLPAGPSAFQAEVFNTAPPLRSLPGTLNAVSNRSYFTISSIGAQSISNAVVTLGYDAADGVTDAALLRIAKEDAAAWVDIGGSGTANGGGTIRSGTAFSGGGNFVLANAITGNNAFATSWLKAGAQLLGKQVLISWTIGNETNISNYAVEHSTDGLSFTRVVAWVNAGAGAAAEKMYEARDRLPEKGINYYRIRQTANDGSISYSVLLQVKITDAPDFILWPSPASNQVYVQHRQHVERLECYSANGQLLYNAKPGNERHTIPVQHWPAGIYQVKITTAGGTVLARFVKK